MYIRMNVFVHSDFGVYFLGVEFWVVRTWTISTNCLTDSILEHAERWKQKDEITIFIKIFPYLIKNILN